MGYEQLSFDVTLSFSGTLSNQLEDRMAQRFLIHSSNNSLQEYGDDKIEQK